MNFGGAHWYGDEPEGEFLRAEWLGVSGELMANASGSRPRADRGPPVHESQRKSFANGPSAQDAAKILHQALRIPSARAVDEDFGHRAVGRVDHRFDNRNREALARGGGSRQRY
jgi:hypothetical protein